MQWYFYGIPVIFRSGIPVYRYFWGIRQSWVDSWSRFADLPSCSAYLRSFTEILQVIFISEFPEPRWYPEKGSNSPYRSKNFGNESRWSWTFANNLSVLFFLRNHFDTYNWNHKRMSPRTWERFGDAESCCSAGCSSCMWKDAWFKIHWQSRTCIFSQNMYIKSKRTSDAFSFSWSCGTCTTDQIRRL